MQVMAVVNGEQISQADLGRECLWRFGKEVLEGMVNRQLIAEACAANKINIGPAEIEGEIERIAGKFGLPKDKWMQLLRDERGFGDNNTSENCVADARPASPVGGKDASHTRRNAKGLRIGVRPEGAGAC